MSILIHAAFAILFSNVSPSSPPPQSGKLFLDIEVMGKVREEIFQNEAAWPMPRRIEPGFSAENTFDDLGDEIKAYAQLGMPDMSFFSPRDAIVPHMKTPGLATEVSAGSTEKLFSDLPAASKPTPIIDFALPPAMPKIFGDD
jgi:hypothetical protein